MSRDLIEIIEKSYPTLSKGQKKLSDYILSHYDKAAYMTASKLGAEVGVSESTVVRYAIELGYGGYPRRIFRPLLFAGIPRGAEGNAPHETYRRSENGGHGRPHLG